MRTVRHLFVVTLLCTLYFLFTNQYDNPGNGKTGAPGDGLCTECHTPSNNDFDGFIEVQGLPDQVFPNTTYPLTIHVNFTEGNPINAGLQLTFLDGANNNVGSLRNPRGISGIVAGGGRIYFEHKGGPTNFYSDTTASWGVDWVSPETISNEEVNLYVAAILSNADTLATGDKQLLLNQQATLIDGNAPLSSELDELRNVSCFGAMDGEIDLRIVGGVPPYQISWNTGDSSALLTNLGPGMYSVTITDTDTGVVEQDYTITEPEELVLAISEVNGLDCSGQGNGSATLTLEGGSPPYLVQWPDGDTSLTRIDLDVGSFSVVAIDDQGCQDSVTVEISAANNLMPNLTGKDESDPNAMDGMLISTPSGGTPPYTFSWSTGELGVGNSDTLTNLGPGTYTVLVGDLTGCLVSAEFTVQKGICALTTALEINQIGCDQNETGSATITVNEELGPYQYNWSNGDTTASISGLIAGLYTVTVTNADSCFSVDTVEIIEASPISIDVISLGASDCINGGNISILVRGGLPPYQIQWSNGIEDTTALQDIPGGMYEAVVTDANGCQDSISVEVISIDLNPPILVNTSVDVYLDENGIATLDESALLTAIQDDCGITSVEIENHRLDCNDSTGQVIFTVIDEGGNSLTDTLSIVVRDTIAPKLESPVIISSVGCDSIFFDPPIVTDNCFVDTLFQVSGLSSGSVFPGGMNEVVFQAFDNSGNVRNVSIFINVELDLNYAIEFEDPSCTEDSTGSITIVSDTALGYTFIWPDSSSGNRFENLTAGTYIVTIQDTSGCSQMESVQLFGGGLRIRVDSIIDASTSGNDGGIFVTITGGTPPYTIAWLRGQTSLVGNMEDLQNVSAGEYIITVLDAAGCSSLLTNLQIGGTVGVQTLASRGVQVFPNPSQGNIRIHYPIHLRPKQSRVIDAFGRVVATWNELPIGSVSIPVTQPGVYFLEVQIDDGTYIQKLLIQP